MAKKKKDNRSEQIRQAMCEIAEKAGKKVTKVKAKEVVDHLGKKGITITTGLFYGVRNRALKKARKRKAASAAGEGPKKNRSGGGSMPAVMQQAYDFIKSAGGLDAARQVLHTIAQIGKS